MDFFINVIHNIFILKDVVFRPEEEKFQVQ